MPVELKRQVDVKSLDVAAGSLPSRVSLGTLRKISSYFTKPRRRSHSHFGGSSGNNDDDGSSTVTPIWRRTLARVRELRRGNSSGSEIGHEEQTAGLLKKSRPSQYDSLGHDTGAG
jgi:hypothetical protein